MLAVLDRFRELRDAPSPTPDDLDALWADLAPVDVPDILGHWTGGDFATGHVVSTVLTKSRWHGKWFDAPLDVRSEEHTSELQSLMRLSYAVFCLKKQKKH